MAAEEAYEPYTRDEFPDWALGLRRSEVLFFGSLPITLFASHLGFDMGRYVSGGFRAEDAPLIAPVSGGAMLSREEQLQRIGVALGLSLCIVLIDYILGKRHER